MSDDTRAAAGVREAAPPPQGLILDGDPRWQQLYNLVASLAHPMGDHRENPHEDEAHDLIRELREKMAHLRIARAELDAAPPQEPPPHRKVPMRKPTEVIRELEEDEARRAADAGPQAPPPLDYKTFVEELTEVIWWMLGERDDLPPLPLDWQRRKYWWRRELRERLEAAQLKAEAAWRDTARVPPTPPENDRVRR